MGWQLSQYHKRVEQYDTSTDEELRKKLFEAGRQSLGRFSQSSIISQWKSLINEYTANYRTQSK